MDVGLMFGMLCLAAGLFMLAVRAKEVKPVLAKARMYQGEL